MSFKKLLLLIIIMISSFILFACKDKAYSIKVGDYKYNPEEYSVEVNVDFSNFTSSTTATKFGILYELTKVKKITNLNFDIDGVFAIEVSKDEAVDGIVTFTIPNVNKYLQVSFISVRPYVTEVKQIVEERTLSTSYKVLSINSKYTPYETQPEDPIITEIHINTHVKGETDYTVTTDDENITVMIKTPQDYITVVIYVMANNGYSFSDDVKLYDNDELVEKGFEIKNNNKEIEYKFKDPNWTPVY